MIKATRATDKATDRLEMGGLAVDRSSMEIFETETDLLCYRY